MNYGKAISDSRGVGVQDLFTCAGTFDIGRVEYIRKITSCPSLKDAAEEEGIGAGIERHLAALFSSSSSSSCVVVLFLRRTIGPIVSA